MLNVFLPHFTLGSCHTKCCTGCLHCSSVTWGCKFKALCVRYEFRFINMVHILTETYLCLCPFKSHAIETGRIQILHLFLDD